jgi:hypothetical protein
MQKKEKESCNWSNICLKIKVKISGQGLCLSLLQVEINVPIKEIFNSLF